VAQLVLINHKGSVDNLVALVFNLDSVGNQVLEDSPDSEASQEDLVDSQDLEANKALEDSLTVASQALVDNQVLEDSPDSADSPVWDEACHPKEAMEHQPDLINHKDLEDSQVWDVVLNNNNQTDL